MVRVAVLAAATLLLESALLRFLSVAQFYHFAFLVVSLALLGAGISGSVLSVFPRLRKYPSDRFLARSGLAFSLAVALGYLLVNRLPFDSYSIAWDYRQVVYLCAYLLALTAPFFFSGLGIGRALSGNTGGSHLIYAANLVGAGGGVVLAILCMHVAGVPGAVLLSGVLGITVTLRRSRWMPALAVLLVGLGLLAGLWIRNRSQAVPMGISLSPYKALSYSLQYPGSRRILQGWSEFSRVDVVASAGVRRYPGLSYDYGGPLPEQLGLTVDGDNLQPITLTGSASLAAADYLPEALAFELRPGARTLILEAGGGMAVLQALRGGAEQITVVGDDPLVRRAVSLAAGDLDPVLRPGIAQVADDPRAFLARGRGGYGIVFLPLTDEFRPVVSGAYSLSEDYLRTVESFMSMISQLDNEGLLVATRWLQTPPSEEVRLAATLAAALREEGLNPLDSLVMYRTLQTVTAIVRPGGWPRETLEQVRTFLEMRSYDLVWAPDIQPHEANLRNRLPEPAAYLAIRDLLTAAEPEDFLDVFPFDVTPPTDDHPFFFHFFDWGQAGEVAAGFGRVWQPFGGSGYFILVLFLGLMLSLSAILILLPLAAGPGRRVFQDSLVGKLPVVLYFSAIAVGYLFLEIGMIQRYILLTGQPVYAFALVVGVVLVSSGIGSALAGNRPGSTGILFGILLLVAAMTTGLTGCCLDDVLGWGRLSRVLVGGLILVPLGMAMGVPFPAGLAWLERFRPDWIPWAWAINGCASVVSAVSAALVALDRGFSAVLLLGVVGYAVAGLAYLVLTRRISPDRTPAPV